MDEWVGLCAFLAVASAVVITVYQKVRDTRWRLEAQVSGVDGDRCITVTDLGSYIPTVNDARLRFERMRDPCATHPAQPWRGLVTDLRDIQAALRPGCDEYVVQRSTVAGAGSVPLDQLPQLRNFLKEDAEFKLLRGQVRHVIEALRDTLLRSATAGDPTTREA